MYVWESKVGTFEIKQNQNGQYDLLLDAVVLKTFATPQQAADAVYYHRTGHEAWDGAAVSMKPPAISDWSRLWSANT